MGTKLSARLDGPSALNRPTSHLAAPFVTLTVTMPDAGRIVTYDRPDAFTALARDFRTEVSDSRRPEL